MVIKTRKRKKGKKYSRKPHKYGRYSRKNIRGNLKRNKNNKHNKTGKKKKKKRFSRKSHKVFLVKYQKGGSSLQDTMVKLAETKMSDMAKGGIQGARTRTGTAESIEALKKILDKFRRNYQITDSSIIKLFIFACGDLVKLAQRANNTILMEDYGPSDLGAAAAAPPAAAEPPVMEFIEACYILKNISEYSCIGAGIQCAGAEEASASAAIEAAIEAQGSATQQAQGSATQQAPMMQMFNNTYAYCNIVSKFTVAGRSPINFLEQCGAWMQEAHAGAAARAAGGVAPTYAGDFILSNDMNLYNDNTVETWVASALGDAAEQRVALVAAKQFKAAYIYVNMFESLEIAYLYWVGYYYNTNAALFAYLLKLPLPKDSFVPSELSPHTRELLKITSDFQYDSLPLYSSIRVNTAFNICGGSEHKYKLDQILPLGATTGISTSSGGDTENVQCVWLNSSDILTKPILTVIKLAEQQGIATYETNEAAKIFENKIMEVDAAAVVSLSRLSPAEILENRDQGGGVGKRGSREGEDEDGGKRRRLGGPGADDQSMQQQFQFPATQPPQQQWEGIVEDEDGGKRRRLGGPGADDQSMQQQFQFPATQPPQQQWGQHVQGDAGGKREEIELLIRIAALLVNDYEFIADSRHDDTTMPGDDVNDLFGITDNKWRSPTPENNMLDEEFEKIANLFPALEDNYQYLSVTKERAQLQGVMATINVNWKDIRKLYKDNAVMIKDAKEQGDLNLQKYLPAPLLSFIIDVGHRMWSGLPFSKGLCYFPGKDMDFSNYVDPAKHKASQFFKCNNLLRWLLGETPDDTDKGTEYKIDGTPANPRADTETKEAKIMFDLCKEFIDYIHFCSEGNANKLREKRGRGIFVGSREEEEEWTQVDAFVSASSILKFINVDSFETKVVKGSKIENAIMQCKFEVAEALAAMRSLAGEDVEAQAGLTAEEKNFEVPALVFKWEASQTQMCGLINYNITVLGHLRTKKDLKKARNQAKETFLNGEERKTGEQVSAEKALGMKMASARSAALPNHDLLELSNKVFDFVKAIRSILGFDDKSSDIQATQVVIFLARIMKYMGDKSHVIGGLIYNYLSGKSFCICTIDRPLVSTIMNFILRGNQLSNMKDGGTFDASEDNKAIHRVSDLLQASNNEEKIINSLKNLYLAISPYDTASHILDKLPGFYGRFLEGVAAGGWTLWIYGSKVNSKEQQIAQRIDDIIKMYRIYNEQLEAGLRLGQDQVERRVVDLKDTLMKVKAISNEENLREVFVRVARIDWKEVVVANQRELAKQRENESIKLGKLIFSNFSSEAAERAAGIQERTNKLNTQEGVRKKSETKREAAAASSQRSTRTRTGAPEAAPITPEWAKRLYTFSLLFNDFPIDGGKGAKRLQKISPPSSVPKNIRKFFSELLYHLNLGVDDPWIGVNRDIWIEFARAIRASAGFGVSSRTKPEPQLPYADWLVALGQFTHSFEFRGVDSLKDTLTDRQQKTKWGEFRKVYIGYIEELTECALILYEISNSLTTKELRALTVEDGMVE